MKSKILSILDVRQKVQLVLPGYFLNATKADKFLEHFLGENYVPFHNGFSSPQMSPKPCLCSLFKTVLPIDLSFIVRVEPDQSHRVPVSGVPRPSIWMTTTRFFIHLPPVGKDVFFSAIVTIIRRYEADRTVQVTGVVPSDKFIHPALGMFKRFKCT